ncbi:hypothetical protein PISMIDRAFT_670201, partial [Pisolithus microcarpus 441]
MGSTRPTKQPNAFYYLFRLVPTTEADSLPFRVRNGIGNVSLSSSSSSQFPPLPPARLPSVLPL